MKKTCWLLLDNRMGSVGIARGVALALDHDFFDIVEKKIIYTKWAGLPNIVKGSSLIGVSGESDNIKDNFPDLVISASRRTAPIAKWIKKKSPMTKIVQLLHPDCPHMELFDIIFLSKHDEHKKAGENVVYITGSPHRITEKSLSDARALWEKEFAYLPRPLTAIIVGGGIKGKPFPLKNAENFVTQTKVFKDKVGGSILLTDSKRTGAECSKLIAENLSKYPSYNYLWGSVGANPYMGFLACADNIIVTGDSVSMCCEACGTGKPVFIFVDSWLTNKHCRFVKSLFSGKFAEALDGNFAFKPIIALNPAQDVASRIMELF